MTPRLLPLALLVACTGDGCGRSIVLDGGDSADSADSADPPDSLPGGDHVWTRDERAAPGSVTFTELAYHPADAAEAEWIELFNPMVLDVDLSGWSLAGAVDYTFPEGTRLAPGTALVVASDPARAPIDGALGPFVGQLDDDEARIELHTNGGRLIDTVGYQDDDPWPVGADGTGATLAKVRADAASDHAENWRASAALGGTPGSAPTVAEAPPARRELIAEDATWRYDGSDLEPDADWADPGYDDGEWAEGPAPFSAGAATDEAAATLRVTADNYYAAWLGAADGSDLRLVAEDPDGDWTTADDHALTVSARDHLWVAAWEAPWDDGGPQMVIAEVELDGEPVGTAADTVEWVLGPDAGCPGTAPGDPPPEVAELQALVATGGWAAPAAEAAPASDPWGWALSWAFAADTRYVWPDTFGSISATNTHTTYALFRTVDPLLGPLGNTELEAVPATAYFRTTFAFTDDPAATTLWASCDLDDGAVVYLNGVEVLRVNLPAGPLTHDTPAPASGGDDGAIVAELDASALQVGPNVLAVAVHQADDEEDDLRFACTLTARVAGEADTPRVRLNEIPPADTAPFWVELAATDAVDLAGMTLGGSGQAVLPAATLAAGDRWQVDDLGFEPVAGEVLALYDADHTVLLDAVRVAEHPRARDEDAPGIPWRVPTSETPGEPDDVELVDAIVVSEVMYHAPGDAPEEWIELHNRSDADVDLSGWRLVDAVGFVFPDGSTLAAGARLVVANDAEALRAALPGVEVLGDFVGTLDNAADRIVLLDARGNPADEVPYFDGGRWPDTADGGGASLELRDARADNAAGEAWAASDESARTAWQTVRIRGVAEPSAVGPDGVWHELVLGLLDAGVVLLDDVRLVRDPDGAAVDVLQDGTFDEPDRWRWIGTHRHSEVVPDPDDAANPVLKLVATGPTEHMHNHVETTLTEAVSAQEYELSFRARWVAGSPQLHSRLYFNRLPRTTILDRPARAGTPGEPNSTAVANLGPTFAALRPSVPVPLAGEPVGVSVQVADPDGVAEVTLWAATDGEPFAAHAMVEGADGVWAATLPGERAGRLLQLYVEATDDRGETAPFPAAGPDSRVLVQWTDGTEAPAGLHSFRLLMTAADSDWLLDDPNLMSNDRLGGTVVYDDAQVFYDVGVRAKGSERGRPETVRFGYGVHFSRQEPFRGSHTSVLLDRSEGVGYGQREVLANLVGARVGLPSAEYHDLAHAFTPRSEHTGAVELQLDRFSDLVLASQFEDGDDGTCFDYELVYFPLTTDDGTPEGQKLPQPDSVVGTPITDLGDDPEAWRWSFGIQNHLDRDDYTPIQELGRTFALGDADFLDQVDAILDVDQWLAAYAFATLVGAVDNYAGDGSQHNARLYVRPEDGRVLLFPHDMDFFGGPTNAVVGNPDLARLVADPVHRRTYHQHLLDITDRAYNLDYLGPWCDQLAELLPAQDFDGHCAFIASRADYVLSGAADAVYAENPLVDFAITTGGGADFETADAEVELRGVGWIDVRTIELDGAPLPVTWLDADTWSLRVPLQPGANALELVALDLGGDEVGRDTIGVTRR